MAIGTNTAARAPQDRHDRPLRASLREIAGAAEQQPRSAAPSTRCHPTSAFGGSGTAPADRARRQDQLLDIEVERPAHDHQHGEHGGRRHRRGRRFRAPGDRERRARRARRRSTSASGSCRLASTSSAAATQVGGERRRRDAVDLAGLGGRPVAAGPATINAAASAKPATTWKACAPQRVDAAVAAGRATSTATLKATAVMASQRHSRKRASANAAAVTTAR